MATPFTSIAIQRALKVTEDGKWGPETEAAMRAALGSPRDNTNRPWAVKRLIIGYQQKLMREAGIEITVDGLMGPATLHAFEKWQDLQRKTPDQQALVAASVSWWNWRKWLSWLFPAKEVIPEVGKVVIPAPGLPEIIVAPEPVREPKIVRPASPTVWPRQKDVPEFFGPVGANQKIILCPWEMTLAWDSGVKTRKISLHEKVAPSAQRALERIWEHYGPEGIKALGLDKYGGSLNVRKMRGGDSYSMHSWGIAIDFDPDRNQMRWDHTKARLAKADAKAFWDIWADEGWVSLGRERDFDWMHVQAARL